jgi:uncharacterized membrane protein HdeD (DUF308 family)
MKKYSSYFWSMMITSVLTGALGVILIAHNHAGACAVMVSLSFVFWFAGMMAPNSEKYKRGQ